MSPAAISLATLTEHRALEESQLFGGLCQLLLKGGDGFLLLGDDGLLIRSCLLQITNPLLTGRQLIGERWTSFFHALLNAWHRHWFRWHREFWNVVTRDAIADDAARWPGRCLPR